MTRNSDTQYDHTREEKYALMPQPTEDTQLLHAYLQKDPSGGYHGSVPGEGSLDAHNGAKLSTGFYDGDPALDQFKRSEQIYSYDFRHRFSDVCLSPRPAATATPESISIRCIRSAGRHLTAISLPAITLANVLPFSAWATDNRVTAEFATGELEHRLLLGAEYHRHKNDITDAGDFASSLNAATGEALGPTPDFSWTHQTRRYYQTGLYLQDEMVWDRWHLDLSGRYDRIVADNSGTSRRLDDHIQRPRGPALRLR